MMDGDFKLDSSGTPTSGIQSRLPGSIQELDSLLRKMRVSSEASPTSPARSASRPAATASQPATNTSHSSSTRSPSHAATVPTPKLVQRLARTWLLILDDWGLASPWGQRCHDLLEILDDRYAWRATLLASHVPVEHWQDVVGDPIFGDAILDRLLNNTPTITLKGASMGRLYDSTKTGTSWQTQPRHPGPAMHLLSSKMIATARIHRSAFGGIGGRLRRSAQGA